MLPQEDNMRPILSLLALLALSCATTPPPSQRPSTPSIPSSWRTTCLEGNPTSCWRIGYLLAPRRHTARRDEHVLTTQQAQKRQEDLQRRRDLATPWYLRAQAARLRLCPWTKKWEHCKEKAKIPSFARALSPEKRNALDEEFRAHRNAMKATCKEGDAAACWRWSQTYWYEQGFDKQQDAALRWQAVLAGSHKAWITTARTLLDGPEPGLSASKIASLAGKEPPPDPKTNIALCKGTPGGCSAFAKALQVNALQERAQSKLQSLCKKGDINACYSHEARKSRKVFALPVSSKNAWLALHAQTQAQCTKKGVVHPCWMAGYIARKHLHDRATATANHTAGCKQRDPNACAWLGLQALIQRRPQDALPTLQTTCETGHQASCTVIAMMHLTGHGVPQDTAQARRMFRVVCDSKNKDATSFDVACRALLP